MVAAVNETRKQQFTEIWKATAPELDFVIVQDTARNLDHCGLCTIGIGTIALGYAA